VDEAVCAIRPGTDVGRYARPLARTHDALLPGGQPPVDPRQLAEGLGGQSPAVGDAASARVGTERRAGGPGRWRPGR
jgi:hypothetical protein